MGIARIIAPHRKYLPEILPQDFVSILLILMKVALITTVGGLIVAVILQIFFNYILSQVESLTIDMEDASISLMDILVKYQK